MWFTDPIDKSGRPALLWHMRIKMAFKCRHGDTLPRHRILLVQKGIPILPKSVKPERIDQNADLFDFEFNENEMERLDELN